MQKVVIIGNGFDLDQGLRTSYKSFLEDGVQKEVFKTNHFLAYVKSREAEMLPNWSDLELALANSLMKEVSHLDETISGEEQNRCYTQVKRLLKEYIKSEQREFSKSGKFNEDTASYKLIKDVYDSEFEGVTIFDFNYTNTLQNILASLPSKASIEHIKVHGSIADDEIIFGVENYADVTIPSKFIYAKKSNSPLFYSGRIADRMMRAEEIYIFGHSLGESDEVHFVEYFRRLMSRNDPDQLPVKQSFNFCLNPSDKDSEMTRINGRIDELTGNFAEFRRNVSLNYF